MSFHNVHDMGENIVETMYFANVTNLIVHDISIHHVRLNRHGKALGVENVQRLDMKGWDVKNVTHE